MILYAESSAVLRWLFGEPQCAAILAHMRGAEKVVCSRLTLIETRRVVARAQRDQRISPAEAADVVGLFAAALPRWAVMEISENVARRAEQRFPAEPVRTLDAIHLASALTLRESLPDLEMLSTDERIRSNARQLGFVVLPE